jgi:hypothetical protein
MMRGRSIRRAILLATVALLALPALGAMAEPGGVTVVNDTEFTLEIRMDGSKQFVLQPGAKRTIEGIEPGAHSFQAVTSEGEVKFRKEMRVLAGRTMQWLLKWTHLEIGSP